MEEIIKSLEKITQEELKKCEENKTVPSKEVLDTIQILNIIH